MPARVVLVHDWLTGMRGGEKVLESLCRIFPDAELATLVHKRGSVSRVIEDRRVRTSIVQHLPQAATRYRHYLPAFPTAIELLDFDDADLVVSTSHCAAKSVVVPGRARHICYCHSPMRYAWDQFDMYFGVDRIGRGANAIARPVLAWLARWDRGTAPRVDRYLANSQYVAGRIARYYNRQASVVYPPVDVTTFTPDGSPAEPYFLVVSALVPYKRIDVAIDAANRLQVPLKIVGSGPDRDRLQAIAGPTIEFAGQLSDAALADAYRRATATVLPAEEDFGIVPVESMACGRPVIALGRGGACETVVPGVTGLLVSEPRGDAFADAMRAIDGLSFDPARLRAHAETFSTARFDAALGAAINETLAAAC